MSYSASTRTANDVARAVKRKFGDESGVQLEDTDLLMWINEAQDEIVKRNRLIKTTAIAISVVDQADYTFPAQDILQIESLHFDGQKLTNMPFAQAEQDFIDKNTSAEKGTPELWWEWGGVFTLWPAPHVASPIKLYYTKRPAPVALLSDILSLPDKYYRQILDYVMQQAYEMDEEPEMSQMKESQFESGLLALAEEERTAQQLTYPTITFTY